MRFLREAGWITADRARAVAGIAVIAFAGAALWLVQRDTGPSPTLGHDFAAFWSAAVLVNEGRAVEAYHRPALFAVQQAMFGPSLTLEAPFFYPPPFLFAVWPMAWLPFGAALATWVIVTSALCVAALVRLAGGAWALVPAMALPSLWFNAGFGQNGALNAALFGGAAVLLERRQALAGVCLGLLCYKPQLALAVPVALIVARRWTALLASGATVAVMALASLAAFGPHAWAAFLQQTRPAPMGTEGGLVGFDKIVSPLGGVRTLY
ncbi:glycosyltransferase family 87 protein, partial [Nostoc sp. NIES-2111]